MFGKSNLSDEEKRMRPRFVFDTDSLIDEKLGNKDILEDSIFIGDFNLKNCDRDNNILTTKMHCDLSLERTFIIANTKRKTRKLRFNGETFNVIELSKMTPEMAFGFHNLNISKTIEDSGIITKEIHEEAYELMERKIEIKDWGKQLISISDGYEKTFNKDLHDNNFECGELVQKICQEISCEFVNDFFNYQNSNIKDLSSVDDVLYFRWDQFYIDYRFYNKIVWNKIYKDIWQD